MEANASGPRFGARSALVIAGLWLIAATLIALDVAPAHWRTRVVLIGLASLLPSLFAIRPTPVTALIAAACWTIPGLLLFLLEGLGAVWLVAAASAFTGAAMESHGRRYPAPAAPM